MTLDYRNDLFKNYRSTHSKYFESDIKSQVAWYIKYIGSYYLQHISHFDKSSSKVLEIGCGKGYLLAALQSFGYKQLQGIDLSPDDVIQAQSIVPEAPISCENALSYLGQHEDAFDVIIMKAVLEHTQKNEVLPFLMKIKTALKSGGRVLIDVPNMDWLFATHERYMDFTHEIGFTPESLRQIINSVFSKAIIMPADHILDLGPVGRIKKSFARWFIHMLLKWADSQGAQNSIWARSIIGVGLNE